MIFLRMSAIAALPLLAPAATVHAHTALRGSSPASGSVLTRPPEDVSLTFLEPARLTSLVLVTAGEKKLDFTPKGNSTTFTAPKPGLTKGRNEIRWTALSRDGHVIEGNIIIVLRSPAP